MLTQSILAKVEAGRLARAAEGYARGAYAITLASQSETVIHGFVTNGAGKRYEASLIEGQAFCECPDSTFRHSICKHATVLALHVIRNPQPEQPRQAQDSAPNLKLKKISPGYYSRSL